ncbi:MAG: molybdenum cofactor biosynthesis protein MoaE [Pseudomonadota bacterium]
MDIRVQADPFAPGAVLDGFTAALSGAGAVVSFTGLVRDIDGALDHMEIEHYPGMTEAALRKIASDAMERWPLIDVLILHRHGKLAPQDPIMMVATASPHRNAAFEAADFLMDYLKSRAPFWKNERVGGVDRWVDATAEDEAALSRWGDDAANGGD